MRHRRAWRKLGRTSSHRWAMLRNMVTSLLQYEAIRTTEAKAKTIKPIAEWLISLGKRGNLHARRQALSVLKNPEVAQKLFDGLAKRYQNRQGGYLRILKLHRRVGDGAPIALVELLDRPKEEKVKKPKGKEAKAQTKETKVKETRAKETKAVPAEGKPKLLRFRKKPKDTPSAKGESGSGGKEK